MDGRWTVRKGILPAFALAFTGCTSPMDPRIPDEGDESEMGPDDPEQTGFVAPAPTPEDGRFAFVLIAPEGSPA